MMLPSASISGLEDFPRIAFVATPLDVRAELPIELIPNHQLRRARDDELEHIRDFVGYRNPIAGTLAYEAVPAGAGRFHRSQLREDWRYYVIEVMPPHQDALNAGLGDIERASQLTDVPIECPVLFNTDGVRMSWGLGGLYALDEAIGQALMGGSRPVDDAYLKELTDIYDRIRSLGENDQDVARAVDMMNNLRGVRRDTPLRVLGLFAVIESLLTHDPKGGYLCCEWIRSAWPFALVSVGAGSCPEKVPSPQVQEEPGLSASGWREFPNPPHPLCRRS